MSERFFLGNKLQADMDTHVDELSLVDQQKTFSLQKCIFIRFQSA